MVRDAVRAGGRLLVVQTNNATIGRSDSLMDATEETAEVSRLEEKYGVAGLPTVLLMACNDPKPVETKCAVPQDGPGRVSGYIPPAEMIERMRAVQ